MAFAILIFSLALAACDNKKSVDTVFPESTAGHPCEALAVGGEYIVQWEDGQITTIKNSSQENFIETFVEPNLEKIKSVENNKHVFVSQEHHPNSAFASDTWGQDAIQASELWNQGIRGAGIKVAIVDAGVDYEHPQIKPRLDKNLAEYNGVEGIDDDNNGFVDDVYGWDFYSDKPKHSLPEDPSRDHGTHVAGIVAADHATGNVKGLAPAATLIPVKFLDPEKDGSIDKGIEAIKYAVDRGAKIINASWGGPAGKNGEGCSPILRDVIASIEKKGVLFVAAAGNDRVDTDRYIEGASYPASYTLPNIISVASSRYTGSLSEFSNFGFKRVHIVAPGSGILSTVFSGSTEMSGTSMASPMVAGAAALLWSAKPSATYAQIRAALFGSVTRIGGYYYAVSTQGHLNLPRALAELNRIAP